MTDVGREHRGQKRSDAASQRVRLPVAVAVAALLALLGLWALGGSWLLLGTTCLAVVTWPLALADVRQRRLPNMLVLPCYPAVVTAVVLDTVTTGNGAWLAVGGGVGSILFYLAMHVGGGMGMGDVKLSGVLGALLGAVGPSALITGLLGAFVLGGLVGAWALASHQRATRHRIPFGPFMLVGFWLGVLAQGMLERDVFAQGIALL